MLVETVVEILNCLLSKLHVNIAYKLVEDMSSAVVITVACYFDNYGVLFGIDVFIQLINISTFFLIFILRSLP